MFVCFCLDGLIRKIGVCDVELILFWKDLSLFFIVETLTRKAEGGVITYTVGSYEWRLERSREQVALYPYLSFWMM